MDPIVTIFRLGGVERPIGSYGVMLALAILVGGVLSVRGASRARLDPGAALAAVGFGTFGAFIGSWVLFVAVEWGRTGSPMNALAQPGLVFFGAPIGGLVALVLACRSLGLPFGGFLDAIMPSLPAAHAMGRLGCFLGGCCFGKPWDGPWAVTYTHPIAPAAHPSVPRHPVPLYESGLLLLLAFAFVLLPPSRFGRGRRMAGYLLAYGGVRLVTELFRGDRVRGLWLGELLSTSQLVSVVIIAGALVALWLTRRRPLVSPRVSS